jgi:hypothetical protein
MAALPTGTVTFLLTDIEGSTRRLATRVAKVRGALGEETLPPPGPRARDDAGAGHRVRAAGGSCSPE